MGDFDKEVGRIGRRKAAGFFLRRLLAIAIFLYFAIAAYGRYHQPAHHGEGWDYVCPCDECDCGPPLPTDGSEG